MGKKSRLNGHGMLKTEFKKYSLAGVANTGVHALCFFLLYSVAGTAQSTANAMAFVVAATLSFCLNSRYTFHSKVGFSKYLLFLSGMAVISWLIGFFADRLQLYPLLTIVVFSGVSWIAGFLFSKFFVFRGKP